MTQKQMWKSYVVGILVAVSLFAISDAARAGIQEFDFAPLQGYSTGAPVEDASGSHTFWINDKKTPVAGHTYRYTYNHESASELLPSFRIIAHYEEMVKSRGGLILYENPRNFLHARISADGSDYWIEVFAQSGGEEFSVIVVQQPQAGTTESSGPQTDASAEPTASRGLSKGESAPKWAGINPSLLPCPAAPKGSLPFLLSFKEKAVGPKVPFYGPDLSFMKGYRPDAEIPKGAVDSFTVEEPNCRY